MSTVLSPQQTLDSPPFFSASWLGCDPRDRQPRLVQCFGPSAPDDRAAGRAADLGLEPVTLGKPPPLTSVSGVLEDRCLVVYSHGREVLRGDPLPLSLAAVLLWRTEVLLVWVDRPLRDPRTQLSLIGLQHVWTGIARVERGGPGGLEPLPEVPPATIVPSLSGGWVP